MQKDSIQMPPLHIPSLLNTFAQSEPLEILVASQLASRMLWPEGQEERSRSLYMTLALRKMHDVLLETNTEQAHAIFTTLVETHFGGWPQYSRNLALAHFPSQGKGSLSERSWQGNVAGTLFLRAFHNTESLNDAAKALSKELHNAVHAEALVGLPKPVPENIMKNYWPRFQHIAHFWAAIRHFTLPEPTDSIIRLDKAIPIPEMDGQLRHGWRGVVDLSHSFLEQSATIKRYKTHKPLLDQKTAFRVIFTE
jgi:hypothetical protein